MTKTKRPKTSVYFHIRHIPLSKERQREIRLAARERVIHYSRSIKGKSRLNRHPIPFLTWNTDRVSLVGHLLFDGEIKHSGCVYTNRSASLLTHVSECMRTIYPFPPKKFESLPGVYKIAYYNVELGSFFRAKAGELIERIHQMETELQRVFLRSFFDDEGSVYLIGNRRAVRGYQHNNQILTLIQRMLKNFSIESKVDKKYNEIKITRKDNTERFSREINFTPGVHVNGARSNSVWRRSLEKRKILQAILTSYKK